MGFYYFIRGISQVRTIGTCLENKQSLKGCVSSSLTSSAMTTLRDVAQSVSLNLGT